MRYLSTLVVALAILLVACGGSGDSKGLGDSFVNSQVSDSEKLSCTTNVSGVNGDDNPAQVTLLQACQDLYQLQESAEITSLEVLEQSEFAASVKVTVKLLACEHSCVGEVEKTYETFLNPAKNWQVRTDYSDFKETEVSKTKRLSELGEDLMSGVSLAVLTEEVPIMFPYAVDVPVRVEASTLTAEQKRSWLELDLLLPDDRQVVFWMSLQAFKFVNQGEHILTFYEKQIPGQILVTGRMEKGIVLKIVCIRLAYQDLSSPGQIKSDCVPPTVK